MIDIEMETKTVKITTCMRGLKKWIDAHPRKNLRGFLTINGRDMTDAEVRRVVSYAVEKGYETEADIPSTELAELLKGGNYENKPILDACCGGKMFYFDKHDDRVLFQDIREIETTLCDGRYFEIKPDIKADFTDMPYPDESFSMVVFDPPHLKYTGSKKEINGWQMLKYGNLGKDWRNMLAKGFAECFRVLRKGGILIFKWNETDIKVTEILKLTPAKPIFGHISGKRAKTHWICFMNDL